jgi:tetratricopeptide (TPR) repeat protein
MGKKNDKGEANENMYLISRAEAYAAKTDYDDAIADFTNAIGAAPANFDLFYLRGMTYLRASRFEPSLADFDAFLSHAANNKFGAKGRDCAMQRINEGACRSLPDTAYPELEELIELGGRKFFPY